MNRRLPMRYLHALALAALVFSLSACDLFADPPDAIRGRYVGQYYEGGPDPRRHPVRAELVINTRDDGTLTFTIRPDPSPFLVVIEGTGRYDSGRITLAFVRYASYGFAQLEGEASRDHINLESATGDTFEFSRRDP